MGSKPDKDKMWNGFGPFQIIPYFMSKGGRLGIKNRILFEGAENDQGNVENKDQYPLLFNFLKFI